MRSSSPTGGGFGVGKFSRSAAGEATGGGTDGEAAFGEGCGFGTLSFGDSWTTSGVTDGEDRGTAGEVPDPGDVLGAGAAGAGVEATDL